MSGDPEQEYFVDGMVEEIITALSRIRWLFVIARNSSFTYKGEAVDVKQVGRELGVRYVLEGSVRKAGSRVRITGQLIDAASGAHLWADRFDGSLEDVFDLQDKVASSVAAVIEPTLQAVETARSTDRPTADLTAYDLYLRAYAMYLSSSARFPEALRLMEQASARDPRYGPALAWAAYCCYRLVVDRRSEDPAAVRLQGVDFARRALEVAGDDPVVLGACRPRASLFRRGPRYDDGVSRSCPRAQPELRARLADERHPANVGRPTRHRDKTCRCSTSSQPSCSVGNSLSVIGTAHLISRRFDEAVPKLLLAMQQNPTNPQTHRVLASCYAHMGRLDDAREVVERLRALTPVVIPDASWLRNAEQREVFLSGLRLAAGEAT
jgi:adenylate cyclase